MPLLDRAAQLKQEESLSSRHIHSNPELLYDVQETAA
jgi:hippurate hydrolase